jgi:hypothetical protein
LARFCLCPTTAKRQFSVKGDNDVIFGIRLSVRSNEAFGMSLITKIPAFPVDSKAKQRDKPTTEQCAAEDLEYARPGPLSRQVL